MNSKNSVFLILFLIFLSFSSLRSEEKKSLYSGGMLIFQPGISMGTNAYQPLQNYSTAIGGILRMYFCDFCCGRMAESSKSI